MKYRHIFISFFYLIFLSDFTKSFYLSKDDEIDSRLLTENSITKVTSDLYMINYVNDYYFEDLENRGSKDYADLIKYVYQRYGNLYDFNIRNSEMSFSCSAFNVLNSKDENLFGRNFDNPYSPSFIIWTQPKNRYKSISFVLGYYLAMKNEENIIKSRLLLMPYAPLDGLNEHGLGISVLVAQDKKSNHQNNPNKLDFTTTLMIRGVLDNCKTTEEAIAFFDKYNMHDINEGTAYHFFITDNYGNSTVIEYVNEEIKVIRNHELNYSNYLYLTNFYITKPIGEGNNHGLNRYQILEEKLKNGNIKMEWKESMELLKSVSQKSTVWSNVYNTKDLSLVTAYKNDFENLYKFNVLQPMNFTKVTDTN